MADPMYLYEEGEIVEFRVIHSANYTDDRWHSGRVMTRFRISGEPPACEFESRYRVQDSINGAVITLAHSSMRKINSEKSLPSILPPTSAERKEYPIVTGVLDYFPAAIAAVAHLSYLGNQKHNPGEPLHHARDKSMDHEDCIGRHTLERGGFETIVVNGVEHKVRHTVCRAWRALAAAQIELEEAGEAPIAITPRPKGETA